MDKKPKLTLTTTANEPPGHDIFCTPENSEFLSKVHYRDLNTCDREIRLLKILPNSGSGFIECELLHGVKLADVHKQYLALSYCAGNARNTKPILVNGARCNVFANLHHALKTVRHYWETHTYQRDLLLWVDQICINQANLTERSDQVGFMRSIYESAKETLICLSVADTRGDGMRWLVQLEESYVNRSIVGETSLSEDRDDRRYPFSTHQFRTEMEECLSQRDFAHGWIEFCDVLSSPWWGRAWVFQEFMVSCRATFLYGQHSMEHEVMLTLMPDLCLSTLDILFEPTKTRGTCVRKKLKHAKVTRTQVSRSISKVLSVFLAKNEWYQNYDLKKLLVYTQNSQSSDERDRIYSMVGLANPGYAIIPDYSPENGFERVLVETTRRIIAFEDSLEVLSYLSRGDPPSNRCRKLLPSWVVDWTTVQSLPSWVVDLAEIRHLTEATPYGTEIDSVVSNHYIKAGYADASFAELPHPVNSEMKTTALQVWSVFLDSDFTFSNQKIFIGQNLFLFEAKFPVQREDELWVLCGSSEPFLLRRCSGGYRVVGPVICLTLAFRPFWRISGRLDEYTDESGDLDPSKMERKRITIF
ncbi:heterokaryon incompatibility 6 OR allele [Fusarium phyllophilum]|uniref:Heterokaryon incompatibility 6 OR allele n=1 Tax=Fusarium phyllophilum TaxID=47803 RepID=A0A8H5JXF3_9HYPO|nr:heterokaryon incompatibility 6 OR allele [Fusarium phyllophilum]